ncbi:dihydrolipoamide acetyltransferase family protein [Salinirubrum litoreum]|uniref:Dihydrolipoamide acetyltransferase family protein n=1 Tax=Salinirubrum litoreum TaxID=1126234 RepID=A0ABD5RAK6_9EURY|nr:dihydrolipoamide acetyltransferase family protein [Salinirubrum litoreum]
MGTKEFKLPDVGEGVAEGELVNWLVEVGDTVTEDMPVAEVETDKALVEVPSPYNGTVKELLAEEGQMVPVGDVIITFDVPGEDDEESETEETATAADATAEPAGDDEAATAAEAEPAGAEAGAEAESGDDEAETPSGRVFAPPNVRRLARELGVDIASVDGSGPSGRITEGDVRTAAEADESDTAETADDAPEPRSVSVGDGESSVSKRTTDGETATTVESAARDRTLAAPATRRVAEEEGVDLNAVPATEQRDGEGFVTAEAVREYAEAQRQARQAEVEAASATTDASGVSADAEAGGAASAESGAEAPEMTAEGPVERVPYRGVRRTIGKQMEQSKYTAPHVTHHDTVVIDDLVEFRAETKELASERDVKLTYMPFVLKAIVTALKEYPELNATLDESDPDDAEILLKQYYNVGIAVATDAGLMVPVVRNVDEKSVFELAREIDDLASRARDRKVTREEMQGGTFSVTNFGAIGGEYATPIINYPETAILGLGAIEQRPVVQDGEVTAAYTLPLSLSIDHRVIDGAVAGRFTNRVMELLQNPKLLLLE